MRLAAIEMTEFRGWASTQRVDLDADVVLVHGANGTGKTSLFDAFLWGLTGSLSRVHGHENDVVSLYGDTGLARVRIELKNGTGRSVNVTRTTDGKQSSLSVETADATYRDLEASVALVRALWPSGEGAADVGSMARALSRSVYLQQDDVRRFVEADSDAERFDAVAELVGVGRLTDLQHQLERQRQQWTKQTNERREAAKTEASRLAQGEARLASLSAGDSDSTVGWSAWRVAVVAAIPDISLPDDVGAVLAARQLDVAVHRLDEGARRFARSAERFAQLRRQLQAVAESPAPTPQQLEEAEREAADAAEALQTVQQDLKSAQLAAAQERELLVQEHEREEELQSLATLALRHLGVHCPVCEQPYDIEETRSRLLAITNTGAALGGEPQGANTQLTTALKRLGEAEANAGSSVARLRELRRQLAEHEAAEGVLTRELVEIGVTEPTAAAGPVVARKETEAKGSSETLRSLLDDGERLAVQLARSAEAARREELERSIAQSRAHFETEQQDLSSRDRAGVVSGLVIDSLRAASDDLVATQTAAMGPLLDRVYARIDPHPSFRNLTLVTRTWHGRGRLATRIADHEADVETEAPQVVLSSSQMNAVALSVFIALNLGIPDPPLDLVLLDDPLQSLDEVNLLGVIDLLRRCKSRRQIIVSTHDRRLAALMQRKLRPAQSNESMGIIRLTGWSRRGPEFQQAAITNRDSPWRIAVQESG